MKKLTGLNLCAEFPLCSSLRDSLNLSPKEYSLRGQLMFHSPSDAKQKEYLLHQHLSQTFSAGELFGGALLSSAFRLMMRQYQNQLLPQLYQSLHRGLTDHFGPKKMDQIYERILSLYPNTPVFEKKMQAKELLEDPQVRDSWIQVLLEDIILIKLAGENPAMKELKSLMVEGPWEQWEEILQVGIQLDKQLKELPVFGEEKLPFLDLLRCPIKHSPKIKKQLEYIREHWKKYLEGLLEDLFQGMDLLSEEQQLRIPGPGPVEGVDFSLMEDDNPHYSPDSNWMPQVILMAKNALVWLYQLSQQYKRPIEQLDQIPDEELDQLADAGFTGLWLIGLWERSPASQEIKKRCGNPEAEASAYSLYYYQIAQRLGGEEALSRLKERCFQRGIRLASDMVPNHTGIDSQWMREHPDWFVQSPTPPFPQYSYQGENLSGDPNMDIILEDHYYDQSDCAVTFKRIDKNSGEVRYIYHGNDGTTMPWNDTAQIDFLHPQAKEAVIGQIIDVARRFPIIRFDAAMVLARKHIQRLWFPKPGEGGAIPSRSEHAMNEKEFHEAMPEEFWREVVLRVAQECPDTLLLAEAFWMMEGYFVRNLGMHRVYNSAFMNMIKDEKNQEYHKLIKDTLDYDPEILKRYVNFMSNPDEDTAEAQFGRGDKYFGVLAMMLTLPGLPMIGHGQLEGFREKYGMEYSRAYYNEDPDYGLLERHQREVYPLMKKRAYFSEAKYFHLYDVPGGSHGTQHWVFAYSNCWNRKCSLFIYNNRMEQCSGQIHHAYGKNYSLATALGLSNDPSHYVLFQEHRSGLWFIRSSERLFNEGLYFTLSGYEYQLFLNFREVRDQDGYLYSSVCTELNGRGTPSMDQAILDYRLKPLYRILEKYLNQKNIMELTQSFHQKQIALPSFLKDQRAFILWLDRIAQRFGKRKLAKSYGRKFRKEVLWAQKAWKQLYHFHHQELPGGHLQREENAFLLSLWLMIDLLCKISGQTPEVLLEEWDLIHQLKSRMDDHGASLLNFNCKDLINGFFQFKDWFFTASPLKTISRYFDNPLFQKLCGVNWHNQILWFNKQGFEEMTAWLFIHARIELQRRPFYRLFRGFRLWDVLQDWLRKYNESQYRVQHMRTCHSSSKHGP